MVRRLLAVLLAGLLILSLFGANITIALDRGPLDAAHVSDSADEAGVYKLVQSEALAIVEAELAAREDDLLVSDDRLLEQIITTEWISAEAERNIDAVLIHLKDGEPFEFYVSTESLAGDATAALHTLLDEQGYDAVGFEEVDRLMANESSYESERASLRSELMAASGFDRDDGFGHKSLAAMRASESAYEAERDAQYAAIADAVLEESHAESGFRYAELEALLADPGYYEQRQREIPDQYRDEFEAETAAAIDDELDDAPDPVRAAGNEIAALTAEALTSEMTHADFIAAYDENVTGLRSDLHDYFRDHAADYEDRLRAHVRADLAEADVPEPVAPELDRLADLVIEAMTTDMSYETFLAEYEPIADDVEAAGASYLWEHRDEYDENIEAAMAAEFDTHELPPPVAAELDSIVDVVLEAVLTDMAYEEFMPAFEAAEAELIAAVVDHLFDDEDAIPHHIELTDHGPDETALEQARIAVSVTQTLTIVLPLLALTLVGVLFALTRDLVLTGTSVGLAGTLVGLAGYLIATVLPSSVIVMLSDTSDMPADVTTVLTAFLEALLAPLATQSLLLGAIGLAVLGASIAVGRGIHEPMLASIRDRSGAVDER